MTTVYKSDYLQLDVANESGIIVMRWANRHMTDERFQHEFLQYVDIVAQYRPSKALVVPNNNYIIRPSLQAWVDEHIALPTYSLGMRHVAIIVSKDFFAQFAIEADMEAENRRVFNHAFFASEAEALAWLQGQGIGNTPEVLKK